MITERIDSLDRPELEPYRTLRERSKNWGRGTYLVAEGEKAVLALLESTLRVVSLLTTERRLEKIRPILSEERFEETTVYLAPAALFREIVGFPLHQEILAIAETPPDPELRRIAENAPSGSIHVALEGISDAENMGMILRNCAGFGTRAVITGPRSCSPYLRRSVRVSLGAVFNLTVHRAADLHETLAELKERHGWHLIGTSPRRGSNDMHGWAERGLPPLCLVVGSEASGLSERALSLCPDLFTIPMEKGTDSLNVANALAVALYEARRTASRGRKKGT